MKSLLYAGAALMIGASIYGFVDYKKTSRSKQFKSLYHEEKKDEPVIKEKKDVPVVLKDEVVTGSKTTKKETISKEAGKKEIAVTKKVKKNKKLDYRLFSRAPLREKVELVEVPDPIIKELKTEEAKNR